LPSKKPTDAPLADNAPGLDTVGHQSLDELHRSEQLFLSVFHASPSMISLTTRGDGRYVDINDTFLRIWGRRREDVIGRTSLEIGFWEDPSFRERMVEQLRKGPVRDLEAKVRTSTGEVRDFLYSIDVIQFGGRDLLLGIGHDITDLRAAEARLRQAQKTEAIGQLTGGIAHDFNNLLAIIHGNLELIDEMLAEGAPAKVLLGDALRAAKRGAGLTHQLLAYSRQQPLAPRVVRVDRLVLEMTELLRRTLGATISIQHDIDADLWLAKIDPNQLESALLNLAVNARDAMPEGGRLTIEAANTVLDADYAEQNAEVTPGPYVMVAITDTGSGMSREILSRVLEPFFTTKKIGQGSGLGLSMVFGFVKQSGGHLKIYSEPDRGTTVRLYLPKAAGEAADDDTDDDADGLPASRGDETVLIVDDEAMVRTLTTRILGGLGYRVLEAADGPAALALLATGERVDLLITDVVLPGGMNGPQLARAARQHRPGLKTLFISGYTKNAIIHNGVLDDGVHLLAKPFAKRDLALRVRERLDDGGDQ
jgi:PAS domain S-box-containing protein